ncbi:MAG: hypothetical protein CMJ78_22060 [Planctomycetaceae bacterium]|nr:hypothetical protein [Planctomycetaceae bacterium]
MKRFRYIATNRDHEEVEGVMRAETPEDAMAQLEARGLKVDLLKDVDEETSADSATDAVPTDISQESFETPKLSKAESILAAEQIGQVAVSGMPLASGLMALSEEVPSKRMRRALKSISHDVAAGRTVDEVLDENAANLPPHLGVLIQAGLKTGNLGVVMEQYLMFTRNRSEIGRRVLLTLSYPVCLILCTIGINFGYLAWVVPLFKKIFLDFGTELPGLTMLIISLSDALSEFGIAIVVILVAAAVLAWLITVVLLRPSTRRRLLEKIPVFGPLFSMSSLSQFCQLLAILVENQVRMPDALRMAGTASGNANLREGSNRLADMVEEGSSLTKGAESLPHFPTQMTNIFRWEKRGDAFPDVLRAAADVYSARATIQTGMVAVVVEPFVVIGAASFIVVLVIAMFLPLIKLLNDLS